MKASKRPVQKKRAALMAHNAVKKREGRTSTKLAVVFSGDFEVHMIMEAMLGLIDLYIDDDVERAKEWLKRLEEINCEFQDELLERVAVKRFQRRGNSAQR